MTRLQAFCRKLVGDPDVGDDLMQDGLYDAWKGFSRLRETAAFKSWLYRIVINRYRTNLRKLKKRTAQTGFPSYDIPDDTHARLSEARERLKVAMETLSSKDRALVTLHELEGWSYPELAEMFGCRETALRTRLTRCRLKMRGTLLKYLERTDECLLMRGAAEQCVAARQERS